MLTCITCVCELLRLHSDFLCAFVCALCMYVVHITMPLCALVILCVCMCVYTRLSVFGFLCVYA